MILHGRMKVVSKQRSVVFQGMLAIVCGIFAQKKIKNNIRIAKEHEDY